MTTQHDDGGPAYPCARYQIADNEAFRDYHDGMKLWDHYAAALQGIRANPEDAGLTRTEIVRAACDYADYMIAERKKRGIGT